MCISRGSQGGGGGGGRPTYIRINWLFDFGDDQPETNHNDNQVYSNSKLNHERSHPTWFDFIHPSFDSEVASLANSKSK